MDDSFRLYLAFLETRDWPEGAWFDQYGAGIWITVPDEGNRQLHHLMTPSNWYYVDISGWQP